MNADLNNNIVKNSVSKISAVICIICASSAIAVLVLLIINSKTAREITSFSLYSSFLTIFYIINSIYHFFPFNNKAKKVFYILSHAFFIMMIWGIYIPPCLISLQNYYDDMGCIYSSLFNFITKRMGLEFLWNYHRPLCIRYYFKKHIRIQMARCY